MARKATTTKASGGTSGRTAKGAGRTSGTRSRTAGRTDDTKRKSGGSRAKGGASQGLESPADALIKLLESPLVIDLLAVGASAALAALAEQRFSRRQGDEGRSPRAIKAAGKAAAAAIGRRLSEEWGEIKKASKKGA